MGESEEMIPKVGNTSIPFVNVDLEDAIEEMPQIIKEYATGFYLNKRLIKTILYSNDVTVISNTDADAILNVYPYTPNTRILQAVSLVATSSIIFAGIGGGLTNGVRSARLGVFAEEHGARAVVLNGPTDLETVLEVDKRVRLPIIYTVVNDNSMLQDFVDAGVQIFNVAAGIETARLVKKIRKQFPDMAIIASGGKNEEQILETIRSGANAITITDDGFSRRRFAEKMGHYREQQRKGK
ncbi:MAG: hydrolase [Lactobacillales bacterium]|jgi:hypothetical protein|nr:hydrolase [Lactobacillales bacterium]